MSLSIGIVGLPNVGKSTLFNALLKKQQAFVANYPFATIEPNIGIVPVPDYRLERLAQIEKDEHKMNGLPPIIPATVSFVDIAGLVKGASVGEGLGNKFLSHIREVDAIIHVVRVFENPEIIKEGSVDPKSDYQTIRTELALSDLQTLDKLIFNQEKEMKQLKDIIESQKLEILNNIKNALNKGQESGSPIYNFLQPNNDERLQRWLENLPLLSIKPEIIVLNVGEEEYTAKSLEPIVNQYTSILGVGKEKMILVCAMIESELSDLSQEEQVQYLKELGIEQSGLERVITEGYKILDLISFLTAGEKEVRAWTIKKGTNAVNAAGVIHTDFTKKFIKAEVVSFDDFVGNRGWKGSRENGKTRFEGKEYIMRDGDVVEFKIGT